jgi:hypothetical protein
VGSRLGDGPVSGGEGIGRCITNGFWQDAFVDADGNIGTITSWVATAGLSYAFTPTLTGAVTGALNRVEDTFAPTDTREIRTVHLSAFYRPVERLTLGGAVIYGQRETADGRTGDNVRLQATVRSLLRQARPRRNTTAEAGRAFHPARLPAAHTARLRRRAAFPAAPPAFFSGRA